MKNFIFEIAEKYLEFCEKNVLSKKNILYETAEKLELPIEKLKTCEEKKLTLSITKFKNNTFMIKGQGPKKTITLKYIKEENLDIYQKFKIVWNLYIKLLKEYDGTLKEINIFEKKLSEESIYEKAQAKIFPQLAA
jgi:hypothetical protein